MITHTLNPTLLHLGPLEIRWYGIMYLLGFFVVLYYCRAQIRAGKLKMTEHQLDDLLGKLVIALIIGARLAYAIFYNPSYFLAQPWKILFIWEGGLSFHGGLIAILLTAIWYARKNHLTIFNLADHFIIPLALANAFGRIGNFVNGELYGIPTTLPWGVLFPGVSEPRHPTQIYEALYNVIIFLILYSQRNKKHKEGTLFALYLILYPLFRFSVEFIKDLPSFGPLTMGQWLSIPMLLGGICLFLWLHKRRNV